MGKIKNFFAKIKPSKRRLIQVYAALLYNANLKGFIIGNISTAETKSVCVPGMNCYSCPGAIGACPLGSLQNALSESKTKAPTYVLGIILLQCILLGRWICGWLCPGGFLQELLYKIKTPKLKKNRITRILSYFKYVLLFVLVLMVPIMFGWVSGKAIPGFCKYVCPIGTFEGAVFLLANGNNTNYFEMLGPLFTWKFALLIGFIVASIFIYRVFCRFFCPLGAIYGIFNKIAIFGIKVDKTKCNSCGSCVSHCKMDIKFVGDHECIQCGECIDVCHAKAIDWKAIGNLIKEEKLELEKTTINSDIVEDASINNNLEILETKGEKKENKFIAKLKTIKKKTWVNAITTIVLLGSLIFAFLYYNIDWNPTNQIKINDTLESLTIDLYNGEKYSVTDNNEKVTVIYFYREYDQNEIDKLLIQFEDIERVNVLALSNYSNRELNKNHIDDNSKIIYGYDTSDSDVLLKFTHELEYPYYVWLDTENVLKYTDSADLEKQISIIEATILGNAVVGNKVGDICVSKTINTFDLDGNKSTFNITNQKGKITIINFWATWCGPCIQELPYFEEIQLEYKDYVDIIAIHEGKSYDEEAVYNFIDDSFFDFTLMWGYDESGDDYFKALGGGDTLPMTVIVDENGIITYNSPNSMEYEDLKAEIEKIINK